MKKHKSILKSVKPVRKDARCLWKVGFEKKKSFDIGMKE